MKKNKFKEFPKSTKIKIAVVGFTVLICVFFASFANILFPNTTFATIINNSIGKFFNIVDFFKNNYVVIIESVAIIFFVWVINRAVMFLFDLITRKGQRSETIGRLLSSFIRYTFVIVAIFLILSAWGVQTPTLLAGAGIIGLSISFGAQSLIEDIIAGLFIIFEKQFMVGDIIQVNGMRGTVKEIGIRVTKIEDLFGDVLIINNSDIRGAINTSCSPSVAICDISIGYDADVEKVEEIIKTNLDQIKKNISHIKSGPTYLGVQKLADSSVVLRVIAKTDEVHKFDVNRALNKEMKVLFDKNNIEIPFAQVVIHQKNK
ncbi:MAG: mechanosensitive ion channel family protein [Bacilli bacterium]|nr:mechanosensitive ion channel family protein [Bacilli bacterium]